LCDLAGSEKINKNEAMGKDHFKELKNINLSLTALGKVIHYLTLKNNKLPIPYRESKLTRVLHDSLVGNMNTYIITTVSENLDFIEETRNTLKFAENASHVIIQYRSKPKCIRIK